MVDYMDFGSHLYGLADVYEKTESIDDTPSTTRTPVLDKSFFEVRPSICVASFNREVIYDIKRTISHLLDVPRAIESFHVKKVADIKDGALLVPKIVLVGVHCPGRKLLDDENDSGQLDFLYDEACRIGSDVMVIYLGLPRAIYTPVTHAIYHPKMEEMVFPTQPLLRYLANQNCFLTVCENCDLSSIQKNVLKEWISKPVTVDNPVYPGAGCTASTTCSTSEMSHKQASRGGKLPPAREEHPLPKKKKRRRKPFGFNTPRRKPGYGRLDVPLGTLQEVVEDKETSIELNTYQSPEQIIDIAGTIAI